MQKEVRLILRLSIAREFDSPNVTGVIFRTESGETVTVKGTQTSCNRNGFEMVIILENLEGSGNIKTLLQGASLAEIQSEKPITQAYNLIEWKLKQ